MRHSIDPTDSLTLAVEPGSDALGSDGCDDAGYTLLDDYQSLSSSDDEESAEHDPPSTESASVQTIQMGVRRLNIPSKPEYELSSENAELIKSVMAKVTFSDKAIPDWARAIPEDQWLPQLKSINLAPLSAMTEPDTAPESPTATNTS
ncbi:hypothetical protein H4R34_002511 [Dimargaris verticillata]|uniref:Male-enhanced antigen 1 n=1 Tax=Dimargaris verticillata TaxID=2761393 RepID=A0A9W8ECU5_9FUNG|nr:hypothetical protein H4R34_002511 [Dimargaris verticillata]